MGIGVDTTQQTKHDLPDDDQHQPVMLSAVLSYLVTDLNGCYVDATFGRGGHAQAIWAKLGAQGRLLALDRDPSAVQAAKALMGHLPSERFCIKHHAFSQLTQAVHSWSENGRVQGILLDLGVSSPQLMQAERGFSFHRPGPLDMRMDPSQGQDAASWLGTASEQCIADVLYRYGDERRSRRIAKAIVQQRAHTPLLRTDQLAQLVQQCVGRQPGKKHPATRTFQAIRMQVNQELAELDAVLQQSLSLLAPGGRLVVLSFHSIEDRVVKRFMRAQARPPAGPIDPRLPEPIFIPSLRLCAKHLPTDDEIAYNRRARSAVLRVAEKI